MIHDLPGYEIKERHEEVDGVKKWYWPWEDEGLWLGPSVEWSGIKKHIQEHCTGFHTAIQAGGACGMYPKLLSKMFEQVVTFEPDPVNFFFLNLNCTEKNIIKFNCALGDKSRWTTFHHPGNNNRGTGRTQVADPEDSTVGNVVQMCGDGLIYKKVDLIYLDIEGGETLALEGLINTIKTHRPVVICENAQSGPTSILLSLGYSAMAVSASDTVFKYSDEAANERTGNE